ncbi:MAG TPA: heavy metal translocating P-type ATPase [Gemmatimonadaceae bacterium]|nr:heavy metal translocating P-type ATPase [Gemmatimonadaceae bacterium]
MRPLTIVRRSPLVVIAAVGLAGGLVARLAGAADVSRLILLAALLLGGAPLVVQTLRGMLHGRFAADVVAMLAIVTAAILGEYFAGVVIVLMQSGGEALERYAMRRASNSLEALLANAPKEARRMVNGSIEAIPVEDVRVGDLLVIRPGDLVPVDAEVVSGTSAIDQAAITGEPAPVRAQPGTLLASGSVNLDGVLEVRATRESAESQYQIIMALVARARRERPPIQRIADRYAIWFTPFTLVMCGVAYVITRDPGAVLAVLVVATPCPLILATPVAVIAGISRAADRGIIVKTGAAIEQVGRALAVVFDKTGTLTLGHPTVAQLHARDGLSETELLRLAASVEQLSSHHLGQAIAGAAQARALPLVPPSEFAEQAGQGVAGTVDGHRVEIGSGGYLRARGIDVPDGDRAGTVAQVAVDGRVAGEIVFADAIRPQAAELVTRLKAAGVREIAMVTGDHRVAAESVARAVGIATVRADLLPPQKVAVVEELARRYDTVVMVGDGINDAPALATATVGVAMGAHGTAASAEAADIVILVDDVSRVGDAVEISRRMRRVAMQSIVVGLGVSGLLMVIASLGHIDPPAGAVMQEALDAAVILNALRAR